MSKDTDRVAELEAQLEEAQQSIDEQATELERVKESGYQLQQRFDEAKAELDAVMLRAEVERLCALEKVREEREMSQAWANDLRERFKAEEKIAALEVRSTSKASTSTTSASPGEPPTSVSSVTTPPSSTSTSSVTITTAPTSSSSPTTAPSGVVVTPPTAPPSSATTSGSATVTSGTLPSTLSATPPASGTDVSTTAAGTASTASGTTLTSAGSAEMIAKFFETQSQLLAAQVQAASLPPLVCFDGSSENDDSEFLQWLERFEERARLAKWTEETKLCQLKLHLTKLAQQVFQMLAKEEKSSYSLAVVARFRSVEIEELKRLEFHRRVQGEETIEQLGMELQKLGRKAFPAAEGKEFEGRFYQALHPRWQRKLNAPCTDETFTQLFERERMLEHHERQFTASAACRNETSNKRTRPSVPSGGNRPPVSQRPQKPLESAPTQPTPPTITRLCYVCHGSGHFARNCP